MAPRDPRKIQADFPVLVADLISQLSLTGTVGVLDFIDAIQPTFIVGSRGLEVTAEQVLFENAEFFDGSLANWAANALVFDTGQLAAGDYDVIFNISIGTTAGGPGFTDLQHRNAANTAVLTSWPIISTLGATANMATRFGVRVAQNERFRVEAQVAETGRVGATLALRLRPTP